MPEFLAVGGDEFLAIGGEFIVAYLPGVDGSLRPEPVPNGANQA